MKTGNILLPIDVNACPLEVFTFVNQVAEQHSAGVTLLNVLNLNIWVPENRLYAETVREVEEILAELRQKFLNARCLARACVRLGKPASQIVAEAAESHANLIVMTSHGGRPRRHGLFHLPVLENVLKNAPCPVSVLRVRTRHDCRLHRGPVGQLAPVNNTILQPFPDYATV